MELRLQAIRINKAFWIILIPCFFVFLIVWTECRRTYLTVDDKEWIKGYKLGGESYRSSKGSAKMVVTRKFDLKSTDLIDIRFLTYGSYYLEACAGIEFEIQKADSIIKCKFYVSRLVEEEDLCCNLYLGNLYLNGLQFESSPLKPMTAIIKGKRFDECIIIDSLNSYYTDLYSSHDLDNGAIDIAVLSKKHGLLYFKFADGEAFYKDIPEFQNKPVEYGKAD